MLQRQIVGVRAVPAQTYRRCSVENGSFARPLAAVVVDGLRNTSLPPDSFGSDNVRLIGIAGHLGLSRTVVTLTAIFHD